MTEDDLRFVDLSRQLKRLYQGCHTLEEEGSCQSHVAKINLAWHVDVERKGNIANLN